jgi:hypothetical protein
MRQDVRDAICLALELKVDLVLIRAGGRASLENAG